MKKVLFITPYFGLSGSEQQLYYILENMHTDSFRPYLFSRDNGVLLKRLSKNIPQYTGYKKHNNFLYRILRILLYAVNINPVEFQLRLLNRKIKPDAWYINTVANRDAFNIARKLKVKLITHMHELPLTYSLVKDSVIKNMIENTHLCIGCSRIVCEKLEDMGHKNVQLLYGFIDEKNIAVTRTIDDIRKELGIEQGEFVWIVSGHATTTKGVDFLIPLIKLLSAAHKIIWVGDRDKTGASFYAEKSVKENFEKRIIFTGKKSGDYYSYFNAGHACLSLSREDSFPLVMLEAGHLGKPVVGFDSGGIREFITPDIGIVATGMDFNALARSMEIVKDNYDMYDPARIKIHAKQYDPVTQTGRLVEIIEKVF